jgi:hypothetical protein
MVQRFFPVLIASLSICLTAHADTLFEGYAKILSGEQHIGYVISRYEFDNKNKQFISTYFLKTGKGPAEITESLRAVSDSELTPISYEYTNLAGKTIKTIDAKFKNSTMTALVKADGKVTNIQKKIPKGTFLSTFLVYLMLKSKDGLKAETNYQYQAIAEEDASIYKGQALVGKEEPHNGFKAFKILNTFKDVKFLSYVNDRGEILGTNALGQDILTELVANPADATANQPLSQALLKSIFGQIPEGRSNVASRSEKLKVIDQSAPPPSKQIGVPPGKGIVIKAQPDGAEKQGN